jgi:hypothetical protein
MLDVKFVPWSLWTYRGKPTKVKNFTNAFTTFLVVILLMGIASGNLVEAHMIVSKYSLPALVLGKGPTQSMRTLLKGSPNAGIGCSGAGGILWFGLPTF